MSIGDTSKRMQVCGHSLSETTLIDNRSIFTI
jgi:hypothetical protein